MCELDLQWDEVHAPAIPLYEVACEACPEEVIHRNVVALQSTLTDMICLI
jgi:hypothetical protein